MIKEVNNDVVFDIICNYFKVKNPFTIYSKVFIYEEDNHLMGILVYDEIYDRIEIDYILVTGGTSEIADFNILLDKVFTKPHILGKIEHVGVRNNKFSTTVGIIKYYNGRLNLKNKEYSVFNPDELEILSGIHKKIGIND